MLSYQLDFLHRFLIYVFRSAVLVSSALLPQARMNFVITLEKDRLSLFSLDLEELLVPLNVGLKILVIFVVVFLRDLVVFEDIVDSLLDIVGQLRGHLTRTPLIQLRKGYLFVIEVSLHDGSATLRCVSLPDLILLRYLPSW